MELDKRLGKKGKDGAYETRPSLSISGAELPPTPYTTIGLEHGYFVVLDQFMSNEHRDSLVTELQGLIQSYRKVSPKSKDE